MRAFVLSLLILGVWPVLWPVSSLTAAVLTAPSLLLLPMGIGLLAAYGILGRRPENLSALQLLLIAYFVGLFLIVILFVAVERYSIRPIEPRILTGLIWTLAVLGWLRVRGIFAISNEHARLALLVVLLAILMSAIRYSYTFTIFSEFPVIDLFQRIQFHGGAWEFSRTGVLNPFVAGSYIPLQQLQLGLLLRLTGADPLVVEWVWPIAFAPLQAGAIYAFCSRIMQQKKAAVLAFCLALAQLDLSNPTNGSLAELATITILSLLLTEEHCRSPKLGTTVAGILALFVGIALGLTLQKAQLVFCVFGAIAIILFTGVLSLNRRWSFFAAIVLITTITLPLHRGALLYFLLGGVAIATFNIFLVLQDQAGTKLQKIPIWLFAFLASVSTAMIVRILLLREEGADAFGLWKIFDLVLMPLAGKSLAVVAIDGDLAPGAGARVALFELARAISPLVAVMTLGTVIFLVVASLRPRVAFSETIVVQKALAQGLVILGLSCLILTGFPFIYRAGFILIIFASAGAVNAIQFMPKSIRAQRLILGSLFTYVSVLIGVAVFAAPAGVQPYLDRAIPVFLVLGILVTAVLFLQKFSPSVDGRRIGTFFVLIVATEVALSRTYFKPYAFHSQTPPTFGSFASFDQDDLKLADHLANSIDRSEVLVSDPKTMTFIRGRTGVLPVLSSSNLDTIDVTSRTALLLMLRAFILNEGSVDPCAALKAILDNRASGVYNYASYRSAARNVDGRTVLRHLGYDDRLVPQFSNHISLSVKPDQIVLDEYTRNFAIVVNATTIAWLNDPLRLSYFPVGGMVSEGIVANIKKHSGETHLFGNSYVAKLKCK